MVNQKYVKNECDVKLEKKSIDFDDKEKNNIYFSKFFGENAFEKLIDFLNLKAKNQKVLIITSDVDYAIFSHNDNKNFEFEPVVLVTKSFDFDTITSLAKTVDDSIRFALAYGSDMEISVAKIIASMNDMQVIGYINQFCTLDAFTSVSYLHSNNIMQTIKSKALDFLYIDSTSLLDKLDRNLIVDAVFNVISKLGVAVECYINCCLSKDNGYFSFASDLSAIYVKLNKILNNSIDLNSKDVLALMDINIELADLLSRMNYNGNDKESIFAFIYKYIEPKTNLSVNALRAVASQVFVKLYKDFITNLQFCGNTFFDIEKRAQLFDKYFKFTNLQFDLGSLVTNKQLYLLKRFQSRLLDKVCAINSLIDKLMYKTLDLFNDSGYLFLNSVNKDSVLCSVYFCSDIVGDDVLLKTMRNLGVLDFY